MNETDKFRALYQCRIDLTGEKIYMLKPGVIDPRFPYVPRPPYNMDHPDVHHSEPEIAIRMPEGEYHRFLQNYNQFMEILQLCADYPQVRDQYHQLLMLVGILK